MSEDNHGSVYLWRHRFGENNQHDILYLPGCGSKSWWVNNGDEITVVTLGDEP